MKRILVAGIGNAWLKDDGFGGEVVKRLESRELPEGAAVFDFGTGGLDLAYEVMRGYDALVQRSRRIVASSSRAVAGPNQARERELAVMPLP